MGMSNSPHEIFGEGLAGLELCGVLGGAEDAEAALLELVDEAEGQGEFGADDGQGGPLAFGYCEHCGEVSAIDGDAAGEGGDASVAGGADDFGDPARFSECPDQRVLAPSTSDYQYLHVTPWVACFFTG